MTRSEVCAHSDTAAWIAYLARKHHQCSQQCKRDRSTVCPTETAVTSTGFPLLKIFMDRNEVRDTRNAMHHS